MTTAGETGHSEVIAGGNSERAQKIKVPEPKSFTWVQDAKKLENFL